MAQMPEIGGKRYAGNDPAMKQVWNYIYQLEEQLGFAFNHIGSDNLEEGAVTGKHIAAESVTADKISSSAGNELNIQSNKAITLTAKDLKKKGESIAQLRIDTEEIASRVEDAEGNVSQLSQTVGGFEQRVADTEGNVSTLQQTAQGLENRVQDAEGNVSQLSQTVGGFEQRVADTEGNVSTLQQTAKGLENRVQDAEGQVSTLSHTVEGFETRVEDAEGNVSALEQTAKGMQSRIQNVEGNISAIEQEAKRIALWVSGADIEIETAKDNTGQQMTISFSQGNAIEEERKSITASVHVWKNGEEITDQIPAQAFSWMMEGGSGGVWYGVKEVALSREDIGKSCQLRCALDEAGSFGTFEIVDGELILTRPDTGVTDTFTLSDGNLYGEEHYTLENGMLSRNAASNKMQVTTSVFDHSILETSNILIKDKAIDIRSGGNINIQAGGTLTMAASALKLTATTTLEDELKGNAQAAANAQSSANAANAAAGNAQNTANSANTAASTAQQTANAAQNEAAAIKQRVVDLEAENGEFAIKILDVEAKANETPSELVNTAMTLNAKGIAMNTVGHFRLYANDGKNSMIKLGGDDETANFSITETGKLGAVSGAFSEGLTVGGQSVWTKGNIIISSSQPTNVHDVLWIQPLQGVQQTSHNITNDGSYHFNSGEARFYTLKPLSHDVLAPGGSYEYSLAFGMILGVSTSSQKNFTVSAVISNGSESVTLAGQAVSLWGWGNADIVLKATSSVNLCASYGNITAAVTVSGGGGGNTSMYIPGGEKLTLTSKNTAASAAGAQTCTIHYIP